MKQRKQLIQTALSTSKGRAAFAIAAIAYFAVYVYQITITAGSFTAFVRAFAAWYVYSSVPLAIIISILIGVNVSLLVQTYSDQKWQSIGSSGFGTFLGVLASGCPGCVVGLFPAMMALFGVSATLAILPGAGIELQVLSAALLALSMYLLTNPKTCKIT